MLFQTQALVLSITTITISLVSSFVTRNTLPLSSKVIFQSPLMENVYKEFILSSKPLNLKKFATAKPKNALKDSKIYYIPIAPMPYRFVPGIGYQYQPVKINPIVKEPKLPAKPLLPTVVMNSNIGQVPKPIELPNTKLSQLNGNYYFNGRPFKLLAYRASPNLNVDKYNLNSNLFFNKNIIY